jgi:SAM-dependent methyltransferase
MIRVGSATASVRGAAPATRPWQLLRLSAHARPFSPLEALLYEYAIADGIAGVLAPIIEGHVRGDRLLDVGSGGGAIARSIVGRGPRRVVGVDPSSSQARRFARQGGRGALSAIEAAAGALPFTDDAFDSTYSSCAWKHWPSPSSAILECARVTRPGGRLCIVELHGATSSQEFSAFSRVTRIPSWLRTAYVAYTMRTAFAAAPSVELLHHSFDGAPVSDLEVRPVPGLPFLLATGVVSA